ncbi:MAG: hypothetical protein HRU69_09410 [Flammeovirgaceae bacterium]|nr:MAG: hypothetical protein HRU69_09410 [Flammeovirgaceae bacterium]
MTLRKLFLLHLFSTLIVYGTVSAQDAGPAEIQQRFERMHFSSFSIGMVKGSTGDYGKGWQAEIGYGKRLNKLITLGASLTYQSLGNTYNGYDYYVSESDEPSAFPPGSTTDGEPYDESIEVGIDGGTFSSFSFSGIIRMNLTPYSDNSKIVVFGFIKPSVGIGFLSAMTKEARLVVDFEYVNTTYVDRESTSSFVAGVSVGPGMEFIPSKNLSVTAHVCFNSQFGDKIVLDKSAFRPSTATITNVDFPVTSGALVSLSFTLGLQYNF